VIGSQQQLLDVQGLLQRERIARRNDRNAIEMESEEHRQAVEGELNRVLAAYNELQVGNWMSFRPFCVRFMKHTLNLSLYCRRLICVVSFSVTLSPPFYSFFLGER
jgi:hypothetical protein